MKIKTSELSGEPLNWAVGKCEEPHGLKLFSHPDFPYVGYADGRWMPSFDWVQGGQIIEREKIATEHDYNDEWIAIYSHPYQAGTYKAFFRQTGPTPLVAAMRCYVASRLGDEADIPEELL